METTANWTWDRGVHQAPLKTDTQSGKHIDVHWTLTTETIITIALSAMAEIEKNIYI